MVTRNVWQLLASLGITLLACAPDPKGGSSLVTGPRLLAVKSAPAEVKPGETVAYDALYVGPSGSPDGLGLSWGFCMAEKPLVFSGPVAAGCLMPGSADVLPIGAGLTIQDPSLKIPDKACATFGPIQSEPKPGAPPSRPADPDTTGGFYQPVVVREPTSAEPDYVVGTTRLNCGLSNATPEQSAEFAKTFRPNENPVIDALVVKTAGRAEQTYAGTASLSPIPLRAGQSVSFTVGWAACPTTPVCGDGLCTAGEDKARCADDCDCTKSSKGCTGAEPAGCTGAEPYTVLDQAVHELVSHRETIRVSWFATSGTFTHDSTGRSEAQANEPSTENEWQAPSQSGPVHLWVVIRDDRGGTGWGSFELDVQP